MYLKQISSYSTSPYPIGFFAYIAGGFGQSINQQIKKEVNESGVHGSGITVSNFIKMIENQQNDVRHYSHSELRSLFALLFKKYHAGYRSERDAPQPTK